MSLEMESGNLKTVVEVSKDDMPGVPPSDEGVSEGLGFLLPFVLPVVIVVFIVFAFALFAKKGKDASSKIDLGLLDATRSGNVEGSSYKIPDATVSAATPESSAAHSDLLSPRVSVSPFPSPAVNNGTSLSVDQSPSPAPSPTPSSSPSPSSATSPYPSPSQSPSPLASPNLSSPSPSPKASASP